MHVSLHQCERRRIMDFFQFLVLVLHITQIFTKSRSKYKKHQSSSSNEGSIENLLYYKDCQRNAKEGTTTMAPVVPLRVAISPTPPTPPPQPACRFPKMCCALTCDNECGNTQNSFISRQMDPVPNNVPPPHVIQPIKPLQPAMGAVQPKIVQRKKKTRIQPNKMQPLLGTRRDMSGFTKEKIKGLISQDDDIRKILKDLVRVTMQKVDLLDMINTEKSDYVEPRSEPTPENNFDEYDE